MKKNEQQLAKLLFEISEQAYPEGAPWHERQFLADLQTPTAHYLFVTRDSKIVGFLSYQLVLDEAEITNVAVLPTHQKLGVGQALLEQFFDETAVTVKEVFLEVRKSNLAAQRLYQKNGFVEIAQRRHYYQRPLEDALIFKLKRGEI